MLGIVGTVPEDNFPIISGTALLDDKHIVINNKRICVNRGTPAMIAAAAKTLQYMNKPNPYCFLVGDIGNGEGCKSLYKHLTATLDKTQLKTLALHYFQPDVNLFKEFLAVINSISDRPTLIADAGFMYVAKMGGDASYFDLFTPDAGELAYLADEKAPHPFYTRGFILHEENQVPELIKRAYTHNNAAKHLLVKGVIDYVADRNGIIGTVNSPQEVALEAIGGTGDTLTGIVSALIETGRNIKTSSLEAAKINRLAGYLAKPDPATQIYDIISHIPQALEEVFKNQV